MSHKQIVGMCLLRNEEYFAAWALMNAAAFCDRIIVMDNRSEDRTRRIVEAVAEVHPHIEILDVPDAYRSHSHLEPFIGTPTWVFNIDGDEVHDPAGLAVVRERLLSGECEHYYQLYGHYVHACGVLIDEGRAFGYSAAPVDGLPKLYNFEALESWWGGNQRLHSGEAVIRPGYIEAGHGLWKRGAWNESNLRCLHLCFMPRSSLDRSGRLKFGRWGRKNPKELHKERGLYRRLRRQLMARLNPGFSNTWNHKKRYARGPVGEFDIADFGSPADFRAVDPDCEEAMAALRAMAQRRELGESDDN